jgi:Flp pilus assembly protein TadB
MSLRFWEASNCDLSKEGMMNTKSNNLFLGLLGGALLIVTIVGNLLQSKIIMALAAVAAIVVAPIWYILVGAASKAAKPDDSGSR